MTVFRGLFPPLITPFDEQGRVSEKALREHVDFVIDSGVDGMCVGSSTQQRDRSIGTNAVGAAGIRNDFAILWQLFQLRLQLRERNGTGSRKVPGVRLLRGLHIQHHYAPVP
jgi:hypothetical protein